MTVTIFECFAVFIDIHGASGRVRGLYSRERNLLVVPYNGKIHVRRFESDPLPPGFVIIEESAEASNSIIEIAEQLLWITKALDTKNNELQALVGEPRSVLF